VPVAAAERCGHRTLRTANGLLFALYSCLNEIEAHGNLKPLPDQIRNPFTDRHAGDVGVGADAVGHSVSMR
jgi:hypothetical protein